MRSLALPQVSLGQLLLSVSEMYSVKRKANGSALDCEVQRIGRNARKWSGFQAIAVARVVEFVADFPMAELMMSFHCQSQTRSIVSQAAHFCGDLSSIFLRDDRL